MESDDEGYWRFPDITFHNQRAIYNELLVQLRLVKIRCQIETKKFSNRVFLFNAASLIPKVFSKMYF
jgi:hypothetical protein